MQTIYNLYNQKFLYPGSKRETDGWFQLKVLVYPSGQEHNYPEPTGGVGY